jgi:hypothetical protein
MQRLEVSCAVRPIYGSLSTKGLSVQQPHTSNKLQYLADRDVGSHLVSSSYGPGTQIIVSPVLLTHKKHETILKWLCASITPWTVLSAQVLIVLLNKCPVCNSVIILRWFPLRLSKCPPRLAEGLFRKPLLSLPFYHKWTGSSCLSSSCSLPWQPLLICHGQAQIL